MRISDWSSDVCSSDLVAALVDDQHVALDVLADDIPRRRFEPAQPADLQPLALAEGEVEHARMGADHAAVGCLHFARARAQVTRQELAEAALADDADTGGILLPRGRQHGFAGHAAHTLRKPRG